MLHAVLHTVVLFGTLGVVEAVQSAHKVAGRLLSVLHRFQRCDARTVHYPEENVRP